MSKYPIMEFKTIIEYTENFMAYWKPGWFGNLEPIFLWKI